MPLTSKGLLLIEMTITLDSVTRDLPSKGGGANAPVESAGCYCCTLGGATTARQREGSPPATQKGGVATACVGETRCEYVNQPGSEYLLASPSLYSTAQFHLDLPRHLRILIHSHFDVHALHITLLKVFCYSAAFVCAWTCVCFPNCSVLLSEHSWIILVPLVVS